MIDSGTKKEEYRDIKSYYTSRFKFKSRVFPVRLRAGYRKGSPQMDCVIFLRIGRGKPEWGAEAEKIYYVLEILVHKRTK
jgi:hypothetical protein